LEIWNQFTYTLNNIEIVLIQIYQNDEILTKCYDRH